MSDLQSMRKVVASAHLGSSRSSMVTQIKIGNVAEYLPIVPLISILVRRDKSC